MKIPIDIRVKSERIYSDLSHRHSDNERPESDEFFATGTMKTTKKGYRIEFKEQGGIITTLIDVTENGLVSVNRLGPLNSHMVFADGKSHTCICDTGLSPVPLQMRVRTKSLANTLSIDGGRLDIDYTVEIVGNLAERNKLSFSVSPDKSIIKS